MTDSENINEPDPGNGDEAAGDEGLDPRAADGGGDDGEPRARRILTDIAPRNWEHPADRAALQALRKIPVFDEVMRTLFGYFGEKPIRLSFQANAVRVSPRQFPGIYKVYQDVLETLDAPEEYPLYLSQTPVVNAGAYGMHEPFIIINSGTNFLLNYDQLSYVLGHEVGHVLSDHVLYRTMTELLLKLAAIGFPIVGLAARVVLVALLEWNRKAELSSDRAGLLAVQDPEMVMFTMMKMASGGTDKELHLPDFIQQAEEYRESGDVADQVFKILNLMGATHPFYTLRLAEVRSWIENGEYDRILRGDYQRRGEPDEAYQEDLKAAANSYAEGAKDLFGSVTGAARRMADDLMGSIRKQ